MFWLCHCIPIIPGLISRPVDRLLGHGALPLPHSACRPIVSWPAAVAGQVRAHDLCCGNRIGPPLEHLGHCPGGVGVFPVSATPPAISLAPLRLRSFRGGGGPGHTAAAGHHAQCAGLGVTDGSHRWRWRDRGGLEGTESSRRGWGEARASPSSGHGLRCPMSDTVKSSPHPRTPPNPFTLPTPRESSPSYHVKYQS